MSNAGLIDLRMKLYAIPGLVDVAHVITVATLVIVFSSGTLEALEVRARMPNLVLCTTLT